MIEIPPTKDKYTFWGNDGAVVRRDNYTGAAVCWGEGSLSRHGPESYYYPFGVFTPGPLTVPTPFPLPEDMGGVAMTGGKVCGFGTGRLFGEFAFCILEDGGYWFRGDTAKGQAADGTTNPANDPDPPAYLTFTRTAQLPFKGSDIRHVSTGDAAVMILTRTGDVWGVGGTFYMGTNFHGLPGVGDLLHFQRIATDCIYCDCFDSGGAVVKSNGELWFTGNDASGRFGRGGGTYSVQAGGTWQNVNAAGFAEHGGVKKVRVQRLASPLSYGSSLVLCNDGTLWFAGSNAHRLVGDAAQGGNAEFDTFQQVQGLPPLRDFDANDAAAYGLDYDGRVWAWGTRTHDYFTGGNALGTGFGGAWEQPTPAVLLEHAAQVFAAYDHGYVALSNDDVYGWGGPGYSGGGVGLLSGEATHVPTRQGVKTPTLKAEAFNATPQGHAFVILTSDRSPVAPPAPEVVASASCFVPLTLEGWTDSGILYYPGQGLRFFGTGFGGFGGNDWYAFPEGAYQYEGEDFTAFGFVGYDPASVYPPDTYTGIEAVCQGVPVFACAAVLRAASSGPPPFGEHAVSGAFRPLRYLERKPATLPVNGGPYKVWLIFNDIIGFFWDNSGGFKYTVQTLRYPPFTGPA